MSLSSTQRGTRQKGFTLIEMSIVLIIIGLIIGGILKGQELIESSRQKNLITNIDAVRAAVSTFADRFSATPGDFSLASTRLNASTGNGGGNGEVGTTATSAAAMDALVGTGATAIGATATNESESQLFWCHLTIANLIGNSSTNCAAAATTFGQGSPLPSAAYPNAGYTVAYGTHETDSRRSLWLRVHRAAGTALTNAATRAFSSKTMAEIDGKYDDGLPARGTIRASGSDTNCPIAAVTSIYVALNEVIDCRMYIDIVQ
ncbi:MAG: prepilin-type N-terminal cleavage/methylation domain-containing protein [Rhodospirillaceae bacterium]|nr:prepilin-type N-terminal cleavage/methylation domain-containing protein [Rhodospirillaceae bacterium]